MAVALHTSNWDFVIGVMARSIVHLQRQSFWKSQLFKAPFGWFFRWLGGYPVYASHDLVHQVVEIFNAHDEFALVIAPKALEKSDSLIGIPFIAKEAKVPIVPVGFDFKKKKVVIGLPFYPTDNVESDMEFLRGFYSQIKGRNPSSEFIDKSFQLHFVF
ncbi:MAG: glycerol acyltransferase [Cyclobacteriaceae bacterium]